MPKLFRIADNNNRGIYRIILYDPYTRIHERYNVDVERHPNPSDDRLLYSIWKKMRYGERCKYHFGFASPRQMRSWFNEKEFKRMQALSRNLQKKDDRELFVHVFSGPIIQGTKQAIAVLEECKLLKSIPIGKFYPKKKRKVKRKTKKTVDIGLKRDIVIP